MLVDENSSFLASCCGTNRIPVLNGLLLLNLASEIDALMGFDNSRGF